MLLVAGAAAVANLDVRYGADGMVVRTGWSNPAPWPWLIRERPGALSWPPSNNAFVARSARACRIRWSLRSLASTVAPPVATLQPGSQTDLLRQVRELVEASERKQQQELALRMAQLARDVDVQRRADLLRIEQGFGQIEGQTGAAIAQQREWMSQLVRVSSQGR